MATKLKVMMNPAMGGKEALGMVRQLESLHLPFSWSRRLVGQLGPVVEVVGLPMLDAGQDFALQSRLTQELEASDMIFVSQSTNACSCGDGSRRLGRRIHTDRADGR